MTWKTIGIVKTICNKCNKMFICELKMINKKVYTSDLYCPKCIEKDPLKALFVGSTIIIELDKL